MLLFSTYRVMWVRHGVERSNTQRIFIQNEEVRVILLFDKFAQQLFIWSAKGKRCRYRFVTWIQQVKTIHRIKKLTTIFKWYLTLRSNWSECKLQDRGYRKIPQISPGLIFFKGSFWGAYIRRGLSKEGNLRFKIDWASPIVGRKFTVFEGNFEAQVLGGLIFGGRFDGGFFALREFGGLFLEGLYMEGLIFGILRY